jgi:catechol 2,3-dioxygenase-like lactoylglutathione lyase family enzyme
MHGPLKPHFSLNVRDLEASAAFYEKLFGAAPAKLRPGYAKFDLAEPALNLALEQAPPTGRNVGHFGIQVGAPADVDAAAGRLAGLGLDILSERGTDCCYALQDKVWVQDPDGNRWEVFAVTGEGTRLHPEGGACCAPEAPSTCATPAACAHGACSC